MINVKSQIVMGFGTFDGLHPGHKYFLRQLKELGDEVLVVVARDGNVKRIKGRNPHYNEKDRMEALEKSNFVDRALMGNATDFYHLINKFQPDVIGLGYDQRANLDELKEKFPGIKIVRLLALKPDKYKSSLINGAKK